MKCEKCGAEFGLTAKFCPECGAKIADEVCSIEKGRGALNYAEMFGAIKMKTPQTVPESEYKKYLDRMVWPVDEYKSFFGKFKLIGVKTFPEIKIDAECLVVHREYGEYTCHIADDPNGIDDAETSAHVDVWKDPIFPAIGSGKAFDHIMLNTRRELPCPECSGRGYKKEWVSNINTEVRPCDKCAGTGWEWYGGRRMHCDRCHGSGSLTNSHDDGYAEKVGCFKCGGAGILKTYKTAVSTERSESKSGVLPFIEGPTLATNEAKEIFRTGSIFEPVTENVSERLDGIDLPKPFLEKYMGFCKGILEKHKGEKVYFKSITLSFIEGVIAYEWNYRGNSFFVLVDRRMGDQWKKGEKRPWAWSTACLELWDIRKSKLRKAKEASVKRRKLIRGAIGVLAYLLFSLLINIWCCLSYKGDVWLSGSSIYSWYVSQAELLNSAVEKHFPIIGAFGGWYGILPFVFAVVLMFYASGAMACSSVWHRIVGWGSIIPFIGFLCSIIYVPQGFLKTLGAFVLCLVMTIAFYCLSMEQYQRKYGKHDSILICSVIENGGFWAKFWRSLWFVAVSYAVWRYFI